MMTNEIWLKVALIVCIAAILALVTVNYVDLDRNDDISAQTNEGLVAIKDFQLTDAGTGTSADGTIFIINDDSGIHAKLVADISVGETDFGGIEIYSTQDLKPSNVVCSYKNETSNEYISIFYSADSHTGYSYWVSIARAVDTEITGGGNGFLEIDFDYDGVQNIEDIDSFHFTIAMGSETTGDGVKVTGVTSETYYVVPN